MSEQADKASSPPTAYEKMLSNWRRFAVWGSLVAAALGALSAFENFIPALVRLSLLVHGLAWLYRRARDWLFGWLVDALEALGFSVQLSEVTRDAILVLGLIFAALNWESTRRTGRNLFLDLCRDVIGLVVGNSSKRENSLAIQAILRMGPPAQPVSQHDTFRPLVIFGFVMAIAAAALCADGNILAAIFVADVALLSWGTAYVRRRYPAGWATTPDALVRAFGFLMVPLFILFWPIAALYEGRRAVAMAIGVLGALIALNAMMLLLIDPMLADPPAWLRAFIDADPSRLKNSE